MSANQPSIPSVEELFASILLETDGIHDLQVKRAETILLTEKLTGEIEHGSQTRAQLFADYFVAMVDAPPVYGAGFEIAFRGNTISDEADKTSHRNAEMLLDDIQGAAQVAAGVLAVSNYVAVAESDTPALAIRLGNTMIGDDVRPQPVTTIDANVMVIPAHAETVVEQNHSFTPINGTQIVRNKVSVPVSRYVHVSSSTAGFDDQMWLNPPMVADRSGLPHGQAYAIAGAYISEKILGDVHFDDSEEPLRLGTGLSRLYVGSQSVNAGLDWLDQRASNPSGFDIETLKVLRETCDSVFGTA